MKCAIRSITVIYCI